MEIEVKNLEIIDTGNLTRARATVVLGPVTVNGCRLVERRSGGHFVSWPSWKRQDGSGYDDIVQVVDDWELEQAVGKAFEAAYEAAQKQPVGDEADGADLPF